MQFWNRSMPKFYGAHIALWAYLAYKSCFPRENGRGKRACGGPAIKVAYLPRTTVEDLLSLQGKQKNSRAPNPTKKALNSTLITNLFIFQLWIHFHIAWKSLEMPHLIFFNFGIFLLIFVLLKVICLLTLLDCELQVFKNSQKLTIFGIFNELLCTKR